MTGQPGGVVPEKDDGEQNAASDAEDAEAGGFEFHENEQQTDRE